MTRLFNGIEGGASKTVGVLIDELDKVYVTLQTGPSNPWVNEIIVSMIFRKMFFFFSSGFGI